MTFKTLLTSRSSSSRRILTKISSSKPYVWGDILMDIEKIEIGGKCLAVSRNLYGFLKVVAREKESCKDLLFIDQVCIDQTNDEERSGLVREMGDIYFMAKQVIIWLGDIPETADFLVEASERPKRKNDSTPKSVDFGPYWSRIWIVQEFLLANDVLIRCGSHRASLDDTVWGLRNGLAEPQGKDSVMWELLTLRADRYGSNNDRERIRRSYKYSGSGYNLTWEQAFDLSLEMECHDVRDRIYGFLGLVCPELRVIPDYTKSLDAIFWDLRKLGDIAPDDWKPTINWYYWRARFGVYGIR